HLRGAGGSDRGEAGGAQPRSARHADPRSGPEPSRRGQPVKPPPSATEAPVEEVLPNEATVEDVLPGEAAVAAAARRSLDGHSRGARRVWPFLGPAFVAAVAYIDP